MKILIDENIPYAQAFFGGFGEVVRFPGRELTAEQLADADALLVRSITKVNQDLLSQAQQLKFVGTATIGEDHIDKALLAKKGIAFSSAPGCNAVSVAQYILSALWQLEQNYGFDLSQKTVAIIGVGNIGSVLAKMLKAMAIEVILCDPFVDQQSVNLQADFVEYEQALKTADVITFHTPLTRTGTQPTYHMLNAESLRWFKADVCLLNASRGEVIDNQALLDHINWRSQQKWPEIKLVLDVWEGEPEPMAELIAVADISTAHIAGYSLEGKARGTEMLYQAFCQQLTHTDVAKQISLAAILPKFESENLTNPLASAELPINIDEIKSLALKIYDIRRDHLLFHQHLKQKGFDWIRKNYPIRREWSALKLENSHNSQKAEQLLQLGFDI